MSGSTHPPGRRLSRGLGLGLRVAVALFGAAALATYAAAMARAPVSPAHGAVHAGVAAHVRMAGGIDPAASAAWFLLLRVAGLLPLASAVARAQLASVLAAALAAALVFARLAGRAGDPEPSASASASASAIPSPSPRPFPVGELTAAVLAAVTVGMSRSFFVAATTVGPAATGAALALASLFLAERVAEQPSDGRAGLSLAALAGVAAGGPLGAAAIGWPLGLVLTLRALRRGERWPLLAPVLFVAGAGTSLLFVLSSQPGVTLAGLGAHLGLVPIIHGLARLSRHAIAASLAVLADAVGILAVLAAGVGTAAMLAARRRPDGDPARALVFTLWPLGAGLALCAVFGSAPDGAVGIIVAAAALALPLAVGILRLADRLGRARLPAAAALGIMIAIWPLLVR